MRGLKVVLAATALLLVSGACTANPAPSLVGPTGLITVPGTGLVGANSVDIGAHFWWYDRDAEDSHEDLRVWHLNWGVCDDVEISVASTVAEGSDSESRWDQEDTTFGVKWVPLKEPDDCISLGFGVYNIGSRHGSYDEEIWYVVGSKSLCSLKAGKRPVLAVFGLEFADKACGPTWLKCNVLGNGDEDSPNFFTGLEAEVADWLTLICETNEFDDFNFGGRFNICENLNVDLMGLEDWDQNRRFLLGVSYHVSWD
jgi:hypothetical protein